MTRATQRKRSTNVLTSRGLRRLKDFAAKPPAALVVLVWGRGT